jgi:hypothetical protein
MDGSGAMVRLRTALFSMVACAACATFSACGGDDNGGSPMDGGVGDTIAAGDGSTDAATEDGPPPPCSGPGAHPDAWTTLGHDAARTSASNGCIHPSFTEAWRYGASAKFNDASVQIQAVNAVADSDSLYVHVQLSAPTVDKIAAKDGSQTWRYAGHADFDASNWITVGLGYVFVVDDGVYLIDATTGKLMTSPGVDWWGDNTADATRFYLVTTTHGDGPGDFVGAWDVMKGLSWHDNLQGSCAMPIGDENNSIAVDGGTLFYAPWYRIGTAASGVVDGMTPFPSGVYAFDAATGTKKWSVATTPQSSMAASGGNVYLVEKGGALVARSEATGAVVWSTPIGDAAQTIGSAPPVVAAGKVIVGTASHVLGYDAATGKQAWSTPAMGAGDFNAGESTANFVSCPANAEPVPYGKQTRLAAATASNTLVVTARDAIHVLALDTGADLGMHALAAAVDPIIVGDRLYVLVNGTSGGSQVVALQSH